MAKICIPNSRKGKFNSLAEVYSLLTRNGSWGIFTLSVIVYNNIFYRDYLREHGMIELKKLIVEEAPDLVNEVKTLELLDGDPLADYNLQYYYIKDKITILGHKFNGLKDIRSHVEAYGRCCPSYLDFSIDEKVVPYDDVHIGLLWEPYPIFDCFDVGDDRTYENYIFSREPITEAFMNKISNSYKGVNFCLVNENLPEDKLPILYYRGDGNHLLLAAKEHIIE